MGLIGLMVDVRRSSWRRGERDEYDDDEGEEGEDVDGCGEARDSIITTTTMTKMGSRDQDPSSTAGHEWRCGRGVSTSRARLSIPLLLRWWLLVLATTSTLLGRTCAQDVCQAPVIPVAVGNVTISNPWGNEEVLAGNSGVTVRGVEVSIGAGEVPVVLAVGIDTYVFPLSKFWYQIRASKLTMNPRSINNTIIPSFSSCASNPQNGTTVPHCVARNGGYYNATTFTPVSASQPFTGYDPFTAPSSSSSPVGVDKTTASLGTDQLRLGSVTILNSPLVVSQVSTRARIGLGPGSDLLVGANGARSWAYDHGGAAAGGDGLLTIGGYDEARYKGELYAYNMEGGGKYRGGCPLRVPVQKMEFGDGRGGVEVLQDVEGRGPVV